MSLLNGLIQLSTVAGISINSTMKLLKPDNNLMSLNLAGFTILELQKE